MDLAFRGLVDTSENLRQRGFTAAIGSQEREHFPPIKGEIDSTQGCGPIFVGIPDLGCLRDCWRVRNRQTGGLLIWRLLCCACEGGGESRFRFWQSKRDTALIGQP